MVLVDSSVWIEALRLKGRLEVKVALEGLLEEYEATWCGPVKLEVLGGARSQDRKRLMAYFECIPYRSFNDLHWEFARECAWRMRDNGLTLPWNDILIGSLSIKWGCRLYAVDSDFDAMAKVIGVRLYQPGYGGSLQPDTGG
jgi:predicted nucleic acid-binding protein